ncbi:MAG: S8 family serine peptidase [Bacteroidales bacterium]|nr:S8 family serine peptidase [Bacteroidales bacterium]
MKKIIGLFTIIFFVNLLTAQKEFIYTEYGNKVYFSLLDSLKMINIKTASISDSSRIKNSLIIAYGSVEEFAPNLYLVNTKNSIIDTSVSIVQDTFESKVLLSLDSTIMWTSNRIILKTKNIAIDKLLRDYKIQYDSYWKLGYDTNTYIVKLQESSDLSIDYSNFLYESGEVIFAEPDFGFIMRVDNPLYSDQWALNNTGQNEGIEGLDININTAWDISSGNNIRIAVIDEGVDLTHPELINNLLLGYDATNGASGINGACKQNDAHGTCCAGIIGSENNDIGVKGIAYNSKIIPIRIGYSSVGGMQNRWTYNSWCADGIYKAWSIYEADILSNSWGGGNDSSAVKKQAIKNAIDYGRNGKGCVVVFSAGNYTTSNYTTSVKFPASLSTITSVISVGALTYCGCRKYYSSCGNENWWGSCYGFGLSVMAPGIKISTTDIQGDYGYNKNNTSSESDYDNKDYTKYFNGTSAACPHVSGVAALILSVNPNLTSQQVRDIIEQTAQKVGGYTYSNNPTLHPNGTWNNEMGYGLVDAYKAVSLALAMACNTDNSALLNGEITSNTTISTSTIGYGEIIVKNGVTLTVSSNLKMVKASKIIVEPGAKLVVNGGEIVGACGEYWNGIRLEGNKNLSQTETNQGVVELNNALISDAKDAISVIGENSDWNKTGGIIKATNTTFKNNRRSIEFMSYGEGSNVNNVSYFRNCTFTWDDDLLANESTVQSHITMYQVKGVDFKGCTFKDERTSTTGLTTHGILTNQAGFIVNNYLLLPGHGGTAVYKNTSFENLTYGIRTEEADDKLCKVENSVFDENDKGIYVTNTDNLYVVNNTFNVKSMAHGMGLVAQNSTNFTIQKNDFLGTSNTNNLLATAGLQIVSSGEDDNLIKQNRFVNLYSGFQALGVNYGINTGLELNCNSFSYCQRGIDIPAFPLNNVTGIKSVQGSQSLSAGNKFTNNTNNVINNGVNTITYYYYGTQENPNYFSMKFLPMQASSGASCGLIGNMTGPNFPLLSNGDGEENEEEESIETSSIAPTTVLSYINKKDYLSAENLLSTSDMSQEEKNDYRLYSSYIQEYGNSYNIPIDILLDLSGKENNIGLVAKQMLYFKGVEADLHPKVIVEQPQDSDTTTITNKMKSVKVLNGLSQNDEYTLSPNPANSEVVVKGTKEIREITILNLQGKELKSFYNTEKFNISFLKNGTYIVRIFDSENNVHYQKLIKQ